MDWLIWLGAAITLIGVVMLFWCIRAVMRARNEGLEDEAMQRKLQSLAALNMGALGVSSLGLMAVIIGLVFS